MLRVSCDVLHVYVAYKRVRCVCCVYVPCVLHVYVVRVACMLRVYDACVCCACVCVVHANASRVYVM